MPHYKTLKEEGRFWISENYFSDQFELKTEAILSQCNGYMGVRAVQPFSLVQEEKGMFVCGLFNRAYQDEVTELVNCPDITWFSLRVNGTDIYPEKTKLNTFCRRLDVLSGEIIIQYEFEISGGVKFSVENRRFASMQDEHIFFQRLKITPISGTIYDISVKTGIDARMTNHGVSHFQSVNCRVYDKHMLEISGRLEEGLLTVLAETTVKNAKINKKTHILERRSIFEIIDMEIEAEKQNEIVLEKAAYLSNTDSLMLEERKEILNKAIAEGYEKEFEKHKEAANSFWKRAAIHIEGISKEEEAAIYFAQYHLMGMTPWHTDGCSIAAKGLTGEGYKGHVFWDTEIFIFPFLLFTAPQVARNLLVYRYHGLDHARKKAKDHNFDGAMFPWESAQTGEEETPLYAGLNIHTGKANKVWSGVKEYHVTADIIYAVNQYFEVTRDHQFMEQYGYEMVFEVAEFWTSCATWNEEAGTCGILDVIGPDEYTEHVDNNAYTNYMASFCVSLAYEFYQKLKADHEILFQRMNRQLELEKRSRIWKRFINGIYLPQPNQDGIIPQDDTFLSKPNLKNIDKYKQAQKKQLILTDYSRSEVVNMQVLKQADVVMLLNLFPKMLSEELTQKNVIFYEQRTIHDSSLSYCAHAQACSSIGAVELAEHFFQECLTVDLNSNPFGSTDGIHSASLGGIWNCLVLGFSGIKYENHTLCIEPHLPNRWKKIAFRIIVEGVTLQFEISNSKIEIQAQDFMEHPMTVKFQGKEYKLTDQILILEEKEKNDYYNCN